ncbi:plasmid pRiA4b ORF-3 family protein [Thioclava sp. L04-15]|uniref:plasmid pRiA4b ORF-3 family protein n=1 Tax=Thioclava sp. L04-15 TaxID=1915318 RepID=UPI001FEED1B0|nr:plasmid pRiA4b ORF-3 family protein [Thioclava sp. L04-15]
MELERRNRIEEDCCMTLVARLKVTLSDVEPQVLRRFDVPLKIKLNRLHDVIQSAMGWTDSHLYEFRAGGVGWGVPDPDGFYEGPMPASKTSLLDVLEDVGTRTIHYIYDFGDNWHHVIKVEKIDDAIPGVLYPRLVRAIGACPPEDVGGFPGYADFLDAIADPQHEAHADMLEWHGAKFDPDEADIDRILDNFERLARKWAPKPRKPKASTGRI